MSATCLVLSGAAGLVCEVAWIRTTALQFGSTVYAISTVLAVFFLGLALGSRVIGDLTARSTKPLATYGGLELLLAALALATLPALVRAEGAYDATLAAGGFAARFPWLVRASLVGLVLLPPTFLMGGTVPLMCRGFVRDEREVGRAAGLFYGLNTLGGAIGCALAGFVLIPALGVTRSVAVASGLNATAGALALLLAARGAGAAPEPVAAPAAPARNDSRGGRLGALVFLAGFGALGQEVLWTRFLALVIRNTVYTYTLTLAVILTGLLIGSLLASRVADRVRSRAGVFGLLQILLGLSVLALFGLPPAAWASLGHDVRALFVLMLLPSVFSGAAFPLAVRMAVSDPSLAGRGFGRVTSLNTLGGIAGALVTGFAILPRAGLQAGTELMSAIHVATGCAAWLVLEPVRSRARLAVAIAACALAWFALPHLSGTRVPADFLANGGELVDMREGLEANLAVVRRDGLLTLELDRWWQGEARRTHQAMAAHLPMLLHPNPRRVLVVGAGAGQTPSRFLMHGLDRLDCVDIEPAVFDMIRAHFDGAWMADPRVRTIATDGRGWLLHSRGSYDVVSIEVGQIFRPGAPAFYTEEFYRRARARLAPGGLISQFVPISFLGTDSFRGVLRTFLEVFPDATLWYNTAELLLVGGDGSRPVTLDAARISAALADPAVARDLRYAYWGGPEYWLDRPRSLLGGFLCGPAGLATLSRGGRLDRDDRPRLDYATANVSESDLDELPVLALLRAHLDPVSSVASGAFGPGELAAADSVRTRNLGDIAANAQLRRVDAARRTGDAQAIVILALTALRENPENLDAQRFLGDALVLLGRAGEAEPHLRLVVAGRPDDPFARRGLAIALHQQHRFAEAIEHYRAAIALGADAADLRNNLGAALAEQGDLAAAASQFEQALRQRPGDPDATRNLARLRVALSGGSIPSR
jgi:spermidine synthase